MTAREAARRFIESIFEVDAADFTLTESIDKLGPEDRALFQELAQGTLREWLFLTWAVGRHAARMPGRAVLEVLNISAYQILFLDRVPEYAIFSEAATMSSSIGLSEPEIRFVHGVLKSIQRDKAKLLEIRASSLERASQGIAPGSELEWSVLNAPSALVDALTVVEEKGKKKQARARAIKAMAAMKDKARMIGYVLAGQNATSVTASLMSAVAPRALIFKSSPELNQDLKDGVVRIQGEASQWACEIAAQKIEQMAAANRPGIPLEILEMAAGKGGKLLGTLNALTVRAGGDPKAVPSMRWVAADASELQLRILELDVHRIIRKQWPQVKVQLIKTEWHDIPAELKKPVPESVGLKGTDEFVSDAFDFIWLDAPCTGFGTLSKLPQIALKRGEDAYGEALKMAEIQKKLCLKALAMLQPHSAFFYTVCTMTLPETFGIVDFFREKTNRFPALIQSLWPGSPPARASEGFFIAMF